MKENSENSKLNQSEQNNTAECGPGCDCGGQPTGVRVRMIVGMAILTLTGALVARAVVKENTAPVAKPAEGFSTGLVLNEKSTAKPSVAGTEIASLGELNKLATDADAVFVYLPGKIGAATGKAPIAMLDAAAEAIKANKIQVDIFTLKGDAPEYAQLAAQMEFPGVIVLVKGRGMVPVQGEITKDKLVQAYVAASSAGACGPSGCGPSGCN